MQSRQGSIYACRAGYCVNNSICRNQRQQGYAHTDKVRTKSDNKGFRIEHLQNVSLRSTDNSKDTDFFGMLKYRDIGDDTNHKR